jgi:tyrosyl-tRNA synthetase
MSLGDELAWRGFIKDKTFDSLKWLDKPQTFYHGIDGSADSLTIGNLAPLMLARRLIKGGWRPLLLVGGATSLVGDPGGKDSERELPAKEAIAKNVEAIRAQIEKLFSSQKTPVLNNIDWLGELQLLDFLREIGKHYSMTELTQRDFIAERMSESGKGISYAEFSYTIIQGYDFWYLFKNRKAVLQIGGSDQWGNMLSGVSLIRKKEGAEAHALSMPLVVNKSTGKKFGKTEEGAIWLDPKKTSPTQFYQFWVNVEDEDVEQFLRIYTDLSKDEITHLMSQHRRKSAERAAQLQLAKSVTELVHGRQALEFAQKVTDYLIGRSPVSEADLQSLKEIRQAIPSLSIQPGSSILETLVQTGLASSNSEARRLLENNAVYLNGHNTDKPHLEASDFKNKRLMLRRGKAFKDSALIELI